MERHPLHHEATWVDPAPGRSRSSDGSGLVLVTDDRDWIDRIRSGNAGALEALFRQHVRALTAFAHRYVQSVSAAQEVVAEVFARLWQGRYSWAFHGTVRGYLFSSAHRVSLETLRRMHRESRWHAGLPPDDSVIMRADPRAAGERAGSVELEASVRVAIARLPARARIVGFMRWSDRLSREEIAMVLGLNVRTVQSQLMPAAWAMRKRLGSPDGIADAWSTAPSTREASDAPDRFTGIDPDRLEESLAGDCIPAEEAALQHDVVASGGEADALDAMRRAWLRPGRVVEGVVDEDAAWRALARRMALPVDSEESREPRTQQVARGVRSVWVAVVALAPRVARILGGAGRQIGTGFARLAHDGYQAVAGGVSRIGDRAPRLERERYPESGSAEDLGRLPHWPGEDEAWPDLTPRLAPRLVALLVVALVVVASVWVLAVRRVSPAGTRPASSAVVAPVRPPKGASVSGGTVAPPRAPLRGRRHRRTVPSASPIQPRMRAGPARQR